MKKFLIGAAILASLLFATTAFAENGTNTQPATAAYISNEPQSIPANSTYWYKFDYAGDKSLVTILMPNGTETLVEFNVFTPEEAQSWWEPKTKPIGRGTPYSVDCNTGEEVYWGECKSSDLKWKGQFNFSGTFYVQVVNYNTGTANFSLTILGTGVHVAPTTPNVTTPNTTQQTKPLLPTTGGVWKNILMPLRFQNKQLPE